MRWVRKLRQSARKRALGCYAFLIRGRSPNTRLLLVLGHFRSGSSLLVHVLNSHPDLMGFGEAHMSHRTRRDRWRLAARIGWALRTWPGSTPYVIDKLLGEHVEVSDDVLGSDDVRVVFLLREPDRTIPSIQSLPMHLSRDQAAAYYRRRLAALVRYADAVAGSRGIVITYRALTDHAEQTLDRLQRFLDLREPLSAAYGLTRVTGAPGIGDPSEVIRTGRILSSAERGAADRAPEPDDELRAVFHSSLAALKQRFDPYWGPGAVAGEATLPSA